MLTVEAKKFCLKVVADASVSDVVYMCNAYKLHHLLDMAYAMPRMA